MLYKLTIKIEGIKTYFAKNSIFIIDELNFNSKKLGTSNKKMKINTKRLLIGRKKLRTIRTLPK